MPLINTHLKWGKMKMKKNVIPIKKKGWNLILIHCIYKKILRWKQLASNIIIRGGV